VLSGFNQKVLSDAKKNFRERRKSDVYKKYM
jgi:hypothetical protein